MRLFALVLGFLVFACGGPSNEPKDAAADSYVYALVIATEAQLPTCDEAAEGRLVYVKAEAVFKYCEGGEWAAIDLRGPKGDKGEPAAASPTSPAPASPAPSSPPPVVGDPTATKLKKGLTKADVQRILGDPIQVKLSGTQWEFDGVMCLKYLYNTCSVDFDAAGLVESLTEIKAEYVDLAGF